MHKLRPTKTTMFPVHRMACVNSGYMVEIPKSSCLSWTTAKHSDFAELEKKLVQVGELENLRIVLLRFRPFSFLQGFYVVRKV
jgi:hypothetical protein